MEHTSYEPGGSAPEGGDEDDLRLALSDARAACRAADERMTTLTALAHELAELEGTQAVCDVLAAALPGVLGADSAAVWLWSPQEGVVRAVSAAGLPPELEAGLLGLAVRPDDVPELAALLTTRAPLVLNAGAVTPVLEDLLAALGLQAAVGVALLSGTTLLGAVTASWVERPLTGQALAETMARLQGLTAHAATALRAGQLVENARHAALHDALTGLPNRVLFRDRLEGALRATSGGGRAAVLLCDLDRFRAVNDDHGHGAGDEVLQQVSARLAGAVRPGDTVSRLGGDEFAVLLPLVADRDAALDVVRSIAAAFERPLRVDGLPLRLSTSVGVALHSGAQGGAERLLRSADSALCRAKRRGRNQVAVADETPAPVTAVGPTTAQELRAAVAAGQLRLVLQPMTRVSTRSVVGAEALVRWQHPRLGLLTPAAFLALAEEDGSVVDIDMWVLDRACAAATTWPDGVYVAVNVAVCSLLDDRFFESVRHSLASARLQPARLQLEVVESRALRDLPQITERLTALRHLGVRVALDDFGTGYSTLSWLQTLPVDTIKVDQSFTADVALPDGTGESGRRRRVAQAVLRGLLLIGADLGADVLVEGVETAEQLAAVQAAGGDLAQGYLLGRPTGPEEFSDLLRTRPSR